MTTKNNEKKAFYVYLNIDGFEDDGSIVTQTLGIEPSEVLLKGSLSPRGKPRPGSSWYFNSNIDSVDAADHIEYILSKASKLNVLKSKVPSIDTLIQIVVNKRSDQTMPILTFSEALMKKVIERGFYISIDIV